MYSSRTDEWHLTVVSEDRDLFKQITTPMGERYGGSSPPPPPHDFSSFFLSRFFFVFACKLTDQSCTLIIPLANVATFVRVEKNVLETPPPPHPTSGGAASRHFATPIQTPWRRPVGTLNYRLLSTINICCVTFCYTFLVYLLQCFWGHRMNTHRESGVKFMSPVSLPNLRFPENHLIRVCVCVCVCVCGRVRGCSDACMW